MFDETCIGTTVKLHTLYLHYYLDMIHGGVGSDRLSVVYVSGLNLLLQDGSPGLGRDINRKYDIFMTTQHRQREDIQGACEEGPYSAI